jgi:hypothetical protein
MADGNSHPFNSDVVTSETISQYQKQSSHQQQSSLPSKNQQYKALVDLLSSNHTSNHFLNSADPSVSISSHAVSDDDFNRVKSILRQTVWPIDHFIRRQLWMNILTLNRVNTSKQSLQQTTSTSATTPSLIVDHHLNSLSPKLNQWPNFVDVTNLCFYHLNESTGRVALQRILFTFALHHPDLTFCPALQPFSSLLLHYFNENEVLYLINRLLSKHWLFGETRLQWEANWNVFKKLLKIYYVGQSTSNNTNMSDKVRVDRILVEVNSRLDRCSSYERQKLLSRMVLVDISLSTVRLSCLLFH